MRERSGSKTGGTLRSDSPAAAADGAELAVDAVFGSEVQAPATASDTTISAEHAEHAEF
jgi:hypothetical protein